MKFNKYKRLYKQPLFTAIFCILLMLSCSPENERIISDDAVSVKPVFAFSRGILGENSVDVTELRSATINTSELDKVEKIRIIAPDKGLNDIFSTTGNTNHTYLYEELADGEECTFYFVANEEGDEGFDSANSEAIVKAFMEETTPFFTVDKPANFNVMTSKYTVKRVGNGYQYRRDYPKPEQTFTDVVVANYNGVNAYGIPVLLYPIYSRFNISIEWPADNDPDFTKKNNGQLIYFDFIDFPEKMKIFGGTADATVNHTHTRTIDLAAEFNKPNLSHSLYFPATSTAKEAVHMRYSFDGKEHTILIKPKTTATFDLNTQYKLPIKVFVNPKYDVWIEKLYTVEKGTLNEVKRNVGDYYVYDNGKEAQIHIGVPHNYRTVAVLKSRLAPADFKISNAAGVYWIERGTELLDKREIFFENDVPYYRQYYVLSYDVDNENQTEPLISSFVAYNTKDETKTADLEASFNLLSRHTNMYVGDLNTFSNGKVTEEGMLPDDWKKEGKVYQFGRNVPFDLTPYPDPSNLESIGLMKKEMALELHDPLIWSPNPATGKIMMYSKIRTIPNFPMPNNTMYVYCWWNMPASESATGCYMNDVPEKYKDWKSLINAQKLAAQAKGITMPDSYFGNNGGDPCPPGYAMPSMFDANTIYYNTYDKDNFYHFGNVYYNLLNKNSHLFIYANLTTPQSAKETNMNPSGNPAVESIRIATKYDAEYVSDADPTIKYAIRFKGTPFASAFRYRKVSGGADISCMPLKNHTITIEQIKQESFWENNKRYVETRSYYMNKVGDPWGEKAELYDPPAVWTSTALPYMGAMDMDMNFHDVYDVTTSTHVYAVPIRCMRE